MLTMTIIDGIITIDDTAGDYAWIRGQIDNWIEAVGLDDGAVTMYVDEEGKLTGRDRNVLATKLARHHGAIFADDWISGPAVIVGFDPETGDAKALDREWVAQAAALLVTPDVPPLRVAPTYWENAAEAVFAGLPVIAVGGPQDVCAHAWTAQVAAGTSGLEMCGRCYLVREVTR